MQADVESLAGALLDKGAPGGRIEGFRGEPPAPGIQALKLVIAAQEKVVQAKILLIQRSNRGARTSIHAAVSFSMHRTVPIVPQPNNSSQRLIALLFRSSML